MDTNINFAECIRETKRFGETVYTNVCNGNFTLVPWGGVDWAICFGIMFALFAIALGLGILIYWVAKECG